MRGFSCWMRAQVKPMRSSAPGAKFSTMTSQDFTKPSRTSLPTLWRPSISMERLLWFSMVKYRLSTPLMSCNWPRVMSPTPGRSTLITSAPNQASNCVQVGPDWTWVKSRILTPSSAFVMCSSLRLQVALGIEIADIAALAAGRRIDRRVDQCRPPGFNRRIDRPLQFVRRRYMHANAAKPVDHPVVAGPFDEHGRCRIVTAAQVDAVAAVNAVVVEHHDAD